MDILREGAVGVLKTKKPFKKLVSGKWVENFAERSDSAKERCAP